MVIRPMGSCTMAIAGLVQSRVKRCRRPQTTDLYFDLSQADAIDSTFTGLLLSLVTSKADADVPNVHLLAPSASVMDALGRMHVLVLFDVCSSMANPPTEWQELTADPAGPDELTDLVIDAHQQLIDADPRNVKPFGRVVEGLREQRARQRPTDAT
jgi:anti-anti-sigma regulatory factor